MNKKFRVLLICVFLIAFVHLVTEDQINSLVFLDLFLFSTDEGLFIVVPPLHVPLLIRFL